MTLGIEKIQDLIDIIEFNDIDLPHIRESKKTLLRDLKPYIDKQLYGGYVLTQSAYLILLELFLQQ
ncbi:hypothetical protein Gdia_0548 [Gluconacetobacter diazotrophicus PA1 5]|nr:hypothetical protein Gdia_0548 [Gluconacetobacter diazotrophicus PA1 5]